MSFTCRDWSLSYKYLYIRVRNSEVWGYKYKEHVIPILHRNTKFWQVTLIRIDFDLLNECFITFISRVPSLKFPPCLIRHNTHFRSMGSIPNPFQYSSLIWVFLSPIFIRNKFIELSIMTFSSYSSQCILNPCKVQALLNTYFVLCNTYLLWRCFIVDTVIHQDRAEECFINQCYFFILIVSRFVNCPRLWHFASSLFWCNL